MPEIIKRKEEDSNFAIDIIFEEGQSMYMIPSDVD
jgi:hypothetical protein